MKVTIDRFEGRYTVCEKEDRNMLDIENSKIPITAKEGDILNITDDNITLNFETTEKMKKEIEELTKELWNSY